MYKKLFDMLICPSCMNHHLKLIHTQMKEGEIWSGRILCENCNRFYPIREGIPCLLNEEQLRAIDEAVLQKWLKTIKKIDDDVIDESQHIYKKFLKKKVVDETIGEEAERLLWEKKLYIDNEQLRKELGEERESKWAVAEKNIKIRNEYLFRFIKESEGYLEGKKILNVGPGTDSDIIERLESNGITVINSDINLSPLMQLRAAKKRESVCSDLKSLPFNDELFDVVFCFHVIHHVHPVGTALSEARRVLKADGKIYITEINTNHFISLQGKILPHGIKKLLRKCVRKYTGTNVRIYKASPYEQVIPSRLMFESLSKAGFTNITRKTASHPPMCFSDYFISRWNKLGFRFPAIFNPIAFEYLYYGTKT